MQDYEFCISFFFSLIACDRAMLNHSFLIFYTLVCILKLELLWKYLSCNKAYMFYTKSAK